MNNTAVRSSRHRGRNEGSIYQRQDGRWVVAVTVGGKRKSLYGSTKREVMAKKKEFEERLTEGLVDLGPSQTLGVFLDRWLDDVVQTSVSVRTYPSYHSNVERYLKPALGSIRLDKLTPQQIQAAYQDMLRRGLSARTVRYAHANLHAALKQAVRWRMIRWNPSEGVKLPKQERTEMRTLTGEQVAALLRAVEGTQWHAAFAVAATTGVRRSELLGLKWDDIDLERKTMSVVRGLHRIGDQGLKFTEPKTRRSRRNVALSNLAVEALRAHRARQLEARLLAGPLWDEQNLVYASSTGEATNPDQITRAFKRALKAAGLPDVRLHDLRHTAATLMLEAGTPAKVVQEMLGHSTISMTLDLYSHVAPHMQEAAAAVFDRAIARTAQ